MVYPTPAHVRDVKKPVDTPEIDEGTVLCDVLDGAGNDLTLLEVLEGGLLEAVALLFEKDTA